MGFQIFSALFGILPEASTYLIRGGKSPQTAKLLSIGYFIAGVAGLSFISEILHRSLPSSIVHCEHTDGSEVVHIAEEEDESSDFEDDRDNGRNHSHQHNHDYNYLHHQIQILAHHQPGNHSHSHEHGPASEHTPLIQNRAPNTRPAPRTRLSESVASLVTGKIHCEGDGTCYGFSESRPCDRMCLPHIKASRSKRSSVAGSENGHSVAEIDRDRDHVDLEQAQGQHLNIPTVIKSTRGSSVHSHDHTGHHHVPKNEYLSIGLQTSKLPSILGRRERILTDPAAHTQVLQLLSTNCLR